MLSLHRWACCTLKVSLISRRPQVNIKSGLCFLTPYLRNHEHFHVSFQNHVRVPFYFLNKLLETFVVMELCTSKHEPFFVWGGGGVVGL